MDVINDRYNIRTIALMPVYVHAVAHIVSEDKSKSWL